MVFVSLEISPDESTQIIQKTHHVALVIDCSGSMMGKPLEDAKMSAIQAVRSLSPNDLVSIVPFGDEAIVELGQTSAADPNIVNVINELNIMGMTNLHGGISEAFHLLQRTATPNTINKLMLFSDGDPTEGIVEPSAILELVQEVRKASFTFDVFGIGDDYNEELTKHMAEYGGGKWEHVQDTTNLQTTVMAQMTEMQNTVITNPQLQINLMSGAVIKNANITQPTSEEINLQDHQTSGQMITFGIKDIIKDQSQTIAMQVSVPPIQGKQSLLTARIIERNQQVAEATLGIDCSDDPAFYNEEADPDPRVLFLSVKATVLKAKGAAGDQEATKMADTILLGLEQDRKDQNIGEDAKATVIKALEVSGKLKPGMSEAEKKTVLHESTKIGQKTTPDMENSSSSKVTMGQANETCPNCNSTVKSGRKFCGKCGKPINKKEEQR